MRTVRTIITSTILILALAAPTSAQESLSIQSILVVGKMAGACGILDSMIQFQTTTRMEGGDEFVARFWAVEAARLGISVQQLSDTCDNSITTYDRLWSAAD